MVQFLHHLEILEQLIVPTKRQNYRQRGDSRDITDGQAKASKQQGEDVRNYTLVSPTR